MKLRVAGENSCQKKHHILKRTRKEAERRPYLGSLRSGRFSCWFSAPIALYFCYVIARPFLTPIFLALMMAIVFHPIRVRIQSRIHAGIWQV